MKLRKEKREEIIKKVKEGKEKWRVEKVLTFDGYFGNEPYKEWKEMLINNDEKLEYKNDTILAARGKHLIIVEDKIYEKSDFPIDEWDEIKQVLKQNNNHKEVSPKSSSTFFSKEVMIGIGIASLIIMLGIVVVKRKKNQY